MSIDPFRKLVLDVVSRLTNKEAIELVYVYELGPERANNVSPLDVLWTLQQKGVVSSEQDLIQLLRYIKREDLVATVIADMARRTIKTNRTTKRSGSAGDATGEDALLSLLSSACFILAKCHSCLQSGNGRAMNLSPEARQAVQTIYKTCVNIKSCADCETESSDEDGAGRSSGGRHCCN